MPCLCVERSDIDNFRSDRTRHQWQIVIIPRTVILQCYIFVSGGLCFLTHCSTFFYLSISCKQSRHFLSLRHTLEARRQLSSALRMNIEIYSHLSKLAGR